ncbi:hypothetical protein [Acinetobacter sp. MD2]|uniref:MarR family winged helix-turn-helix transcriptional regulator n=1 Tax=Acinetobacter sp. MD2 TaxID=2600066 RepID=UPI002D1EF15A|nr:hypothetical protein [Acinetobacter sp. MD2]MEB3766361.1 hypothetical protein [Acinetobacter sp. MD2]
MQKISDLEQNVIDNLRQVIMVLKKRLATQPKFANLSHSQLNVLIYLEKHTTATVTELAKNEGISVQSMGVNIQFLKDKHLLVFKKDMQDKRKTILSLSEQCGRDVRLFKQQSDLWFAEQINTKLSDAEQEQLLIGVRLLAKTFNDLK